LPAGPVSARHRNNGVIHELSHSYWGGFPVGGRPDLSWDVPADGSRSPTMQN
jgi:hypothetical protein